MRKKQHGASRADYLKIYGPAAILAAIAFLVTYQFVEPAPPDRIVMATGEPDGAYYAFGKQYREILARDNVELELRITDGSAENIELLEAADSDVQVAFVQGGMQPLARTDTLVSLATLYYEPLWIFHRSDMPLESLRDLGGKRVYIGPENSGTRALALLLLSDNSIVEGDFELASMSGSEAKEALRSNRIEVLFVVASPNSPNVRQLLETDGVQLMSLQRGEAYTRRHRFLSLQSLPQGAIDLATDLPPENVTLLAPTSNLVATPDLHPALVDLLLQAADQLHEQGSLFARPGEFPASEYLDFPLSIDAKRFFEHGSPFLRRVLPFWAATLVDRMKVLLLPLIALAFPLLRFMPPVYKWRMRARVYRWYKELRAVEEFVGQVVTSEQVSSKLSELERIEAEVQEVTVPSGYAENLYHLRLHIGYVRDQLHRQNHAMEIDKPK
jgi:TRAP transporter TAXI family solute receptor